MTSDIYRYRILRENLGVYVDCDVYCLKPFLDVDYLFGWEAEHIIGSAVLKVPPDSELLRSILKDAENPKFVPPWYGHRGKMKLRMQQILGTTDIRPYLRWGSIGPRLFTHHVMRLRLQKHAMDADIFYPSHYTHKDLLNEPGMTIEDHTTRRSLAIHLWCSASVYREGNHLTVTLRAA